MRLPRTSRFIASWLAVLAILMAALAPAVSQARGGSPWAEVCSAADGAPRQPAAPAGHVLDHCPYCGLHADGFAPAPAAADAGLLLPLRFERPLAFWAAPRTPHAWRGAPPRGPPTFS